MVRAERCARARCADPPTTHIVRPVESAYTRCMGSRRLRRVDSRGGRLLPLALWCTALACARFGYDYAKRESSEDTPGNDVERPADGGNAGPEPVPPAKPEPPIPSQPVCAVGSANCDGNSENGCEADLENDPSQCGACAKACESGLICSAGDCVASPCAAGSGDCDGDPSACEASLASSLEHCGFCNNACSAPNGSPACVAGECRVQGCEGGFADCDGVASNGCEVPLASTTEHCGACNAPCTNPHGPTLCSGSVCAPSCDPGYGDCDESLQNGCETSLDSVDHCGGCDTVCPANGGTPVCNAGVCGTVCDLDGTFALKLTAPCSWPSSQTRRAGSGTLIYWLKADLDQTGTNVAASVTECGRVKPPVTNTADETVLSGFSDNLYDNDYLPSSSAALTLSTASPGASFSWPLTANLMGISMTDPKTDAWPTAASQVSAARRIDMDGDGKPGMTGSYDGGDYPRTSTFGSGRADLFYFGARLAFSLSGSLTSCSASSGSATVRHADMRIFGCNRLNSTQDCSTSESDLLDTTTPPLTVGAGSYTLTRLPNGSSCAAVRAALP